MKLDKACLVASIFIFFHGCSSSQKASYYTVRSQIEHGDMGFGDTLRVNEYINAFDQPELKSPTGADLALTATPFYSAVPVDTKQMIVQVAVRSRRITKAEQDRRIGLAIVLDISGSMLDENRMTHAKDALIKSLQELPEKTYFSLVVFNNEARVAVDPVQIDSRSRQRIVTTISNLTAAGGTDIEAGLVKGYGTLTQFPKTAVSRLLLLTDGVSTVGATSPKALAEKSGTAYIDGARISTIGIGYGTNEEVLREIAQKGQGHYYFAATPQVLTGYLRDDLRSVISPVAKDVSIHLKAAPGWKLNRVYGYEDVKIEKDTVQLSMGELNADDWRIVLAELARDAGSSGPVLDATLSYTPVSDPKTKSISTAAKVYPGKFTKEPGVAKNAVIFSDAMALKEISRLMNVGKPEDALGVAEVQLANIRAARSDDPKSELKKEEETFVAVSSKIRSKFKSPAIQPVALQVNDRAELLRKALGIAEVVAPGPWVTVLRLLAIALPN